MKPKVYKPGGWGRWWHWVCRVGECWQGGKSEHWEIAHLDALEHDKTHGKKRIAHDNDLTPPGGIPRYNPKD